MAQVLVIIKPNRKNQTCSLKISYNKKENNSHIKI